MRAVQGHSPATDLTLRSPISQHRSVPLHQLEFVASCGRWPALHVIPALVDRLRSLCSTTSLTCCAESARCAKGARQRLLSNRNVTPRARGLPRTQPPRALRIHPSDTSQRGCARSRLLWPRQRWSRSAYPFALQWACRTLDADRGRSATAGPSETSALPVPPNQTPAAADTVEVRVPWPLARDRRLRRGSARHAPGRGQIERGRVMEPPTGCEGVRFVG